MSLSFYLACGFALTTLVFAYTTFAQFRKVEVYERWYSELAPIVQQIYKQLKKLDKNDAFEAGDELSVFFYSLRQMMKKLMKFGFYEDAKVEEDFPPK